MKEKTIQITVPEGYEVDKEKSSFEKIVFRALPEKGLPKTWEELGIVKGYFVDSDSHVLSANAIVIPQVRNVFPTREEAEASIALAMLCQLRDRYNGGWKPDWNDSETPKPVILIYRDEPCEGNVSSRRHLLYFRDEELRDEFMKNFADLIETAKPLLG